MSAGPRSIRLGRNEGYKNSQITKRGQRRFAHVFQRLGKHIMGHNQSRSMDFATR